MAFALCGRNKKNPIESQSDSFYFYKLKYSILDFHSVD